MKKKTINKVLNHKFNEFLESITDESVKKLVKNNTIITGGCIASMLLKEQINDFDIYFTNRETTLAVAKYYVNKFLASGKMKHADGKEVDIQVIEDKEDRVEIYIKSAGVASESKKDGYKYFESAPEEEAEEFLNELFQNEKTENTTEKYRPVFLSPNAITLSDKIQIVIRFYGDPDNIHQHYDYIHCTNYWLSKDGKLVLKQPALEALLAKELIYVGSKYPICSVIRTRKFIKRGWSITAGQYLKMAWQISKLNLENIETLEDQLTGVDVAYFLQLVDILKETKKKKEEEGGKWEIDYTYIATIIDKIF